MGVKRHLLAQRRIALGFTQEQLAEYLEVAPSTVRRWESGATEPKPWVRPKLARHLRVSVDQLDELLAEGTPRKTIHDDQVMDILRSPGNVDLVAVARLREHMHSIDERYDSAPSTLLLAETGICLEKVGILGNHARSHRIRRELRALEADTATLMGKLVWDGSQRRNNSIANKHFNRAVDAAREIGNKSAEGLALLRKSFTALYGVKDPVAGLAITMRTAELTKGVSHVLTGLSVLHSAEAYAMRGQRSECERALSAAEIHLARISNSDVAIELYSEHLFARLAGSCYLFLNQARRAEVILETAARGQHPSKSHAIILANLGLACLRQNRPDDAALVLHRAIDLVEVNWGGGGLSLIFAACRELWSRRGGRGRHEAVVQDVLDRVMALIAST